MCYHSTMIKLLHKLPRKLTVAFSGGVDSVAAINFLSNNHDVTAAFFHHGTENSDRAHEFALKFCDKHNIMLNVGYLRKNKSKDESWEEFWRNQRYMFLSQFDNVVTAHHLDDCVETYLWSSMHGKSKIISPRRHNIWRPFLTTPKSEFISWAKRKKLDWCEDLSNQDDKYMRNYIRKHIVPHAYKVNPGLDKVVKKLVEEELHTGGTLREILASLK